MDYSEYIYEDNVECYFYGSFYCDYWYGDDCSMYYTVDVSAETITFNFGYGDEVVAFDDLADKFNEVSKCATGYYAPIYATSI